MEDSDLIRDLLSRLAGLDERTRAIQDSVNQIRLDIKDRTENLEQELHDEITEVKDQIKALRKETDEQYVKKVEFDPVKKLVYGVVAFFLVSIGGLMFAMLKGGASFPFVH